MYPKKANHMSPVDKREKEKIQRREQLKNLIINKFKTKFVYGNSDNEERNRQITKEVNYFIENEK
jgi:hypothetical protein